LRFVDSNVFIHAFSIPRRPLTEKEVLVKNEAKKIVRRIEEGENVALTIIHLSEVLNILEARLNLQRALGFLSWIISSENVKVYPVSIEDYEKSMLLAKEKNVSIKDLLPYEATNVRSGKN